VKKLKEHQIKLLIIKLKNIQMRNIEVLQNSKINVIENSDISAMLISNSEICENTKKEAEKEVVEEVTDLGPLILDAIGMFSVLQFSLLGLLRHGFRGVKAPKKEPKKCQKKDENCDNASSDDTSAINRDEKLNNNEDFNKTDKSCHNPNNNKIEDAKNNNITIPLSENKDNVNKKNENKKNDGNENEVEIGPLAGGNMVPLCVYCGCEVKNHSRCSTCKSPYCSRHHQQLHWHTHKVSGGERREEKREEGRIGEGGERRNRKETEGREGGRGWKGFDGSRRRRR
jgi:hypothetical protein